ncbi:MAG: hypothetical protein ACK2U5_12195, partial [Candidatus Promineifilaceae bacterium]
RPGLDLGGIGPEAESQALAGMYTTGVHDQVSKQCLVAARLQGDGRISLPQREPSQQRYLEFLFSLDAGIYPGCLPLFDDVRHDAGWRHLAPGLPHYNSQLQLTLQT